MAPTIVAVDTDTLNAVCTSGRTSDCDRAVKAAFKAFVLQKPKANAVNAQIGLVAAMLISAYNANRDLFRLRFTIMSLADYSSDAGQVDALLAINRLMLDGELVTLSATALSPS